MKKERIRYKELCFEWVQHSGMLVISALIGDCLVHRRYMGYTKREAARLFLQEANGEGEMT